jgi:hypothetical protein
MKNVGNLWFVSGAYSPAGRPKLEDAVMRHARKEFMYTLITEADLPNLREALEKYQERLYGENRRLKKADIIVGPGVRITGGEEYRYVYIGEQHLHLTKVNAFYVNVEEG